jgi:uncharacterized protein
VSSALLLVEAIRACARYGRGYAEAAREGVERMALLPVDVDTLESAADLEPRGLRSLDAIHLATALSIVEDLGVLLSYDERLCEAAREAGLPVRTPGLPVH